MDRPPNKKQPRKNPDDYLKRILERYVIAPFFVIVGMWIVGSVIDSALKTSNAFAIIFVSIGGIGVIGYYYLKFWRHGEDTHDDE